MAKSTTGGLTGSQETVLLEIEEPYPTRKLICGYELLLQHKSLRFADKNLLYICQFCNYFHLLITTYFVSFLKKLYTLCFQNVH